MRSEGRLMWCDMHTCTGLYMHTCSELCLLLIEGDYWCHIPLLSVHPISYYYAGSSGTSGDLVVTDVKFKGRRTPSLGQPWRASESPLG